MIYIIYNREFSEMAKKVKEVGIDDILPNESITYIGSKRYPSKIKHFYNKKTTTANSGDSEKYKKKHILRNKKVSVPKQNLLIMKYQTPIIITFD